MELRFKMGGFGGYHNGVEKYFETLGFTRTYSVKDADFLVLPGGSDVNPRWYEDDEIQETRSGSLYSDSSSFQDIAAFAKENKKIIGICRGAQELCVSAGGHLVQDIKGHVGTDHTILMQDGATIGVNSNHHQMMYPYTLNKNEYSILGWAQGVSHDEVVALRKAEPDKSKIKNHIAYVIGNKMSDEGIDALVTEDDLIKNGKKTIIEPEIVVFHSINGLAIQFHPERMEHEKYPSGSAYTERIIMGFLLNEL
jgi:gamma-glutamyl-gamma-aminobutyrate hydrolase PuuD